MSTEMKQEGRDFVAALARGLNVIEAFTAAQPEMTISELAAATQLSPATARRCLLTLEALGYVRAHGRRYLLCPKVLSLGNAYVDSMNLREVGQMFLQGLVETFHDAASLTVLSGNDVLYVAHVASTMPTRFTRHAGARLPAHATSTGLLLLAHLDREKRQAYLAQTPLPGYTSKTPTRAAELRKIFDEIAHQGYAMAEDVLEYGTIALAAPVRGPAGQVIASVNCVGDKTRVTRAELLRTRLAPLRSAAAGIEKALVRFPALVHSVAG
jgi:IclR family pca regulon transcriptional regulator